MGFKTEVDYWLAKWILTGREENSLISGAETKAIWQKLIDTFDPPMRSIEVVNEKLPEERYGSRTENGTNPLLNKPAESSKSKRRKVAIYARVSTDHE